MNLYSIELARSNLSKLVIEQANNIKRVLGVNYEEIENAPSTYEDLVINWNDAKMNKAPVYVYSESCENVIYLSKEANWAFRFWHDYLHYYWQKDFTYASELFIGNIQMAVVAQHYGLGSLEYQLMQADTIGQVEFYQRENSFVPNQLKFAIDYIGEL
jgi:hypothetical protein